MENEELANNNEEQQIEKKDSRFKRFFGTAKEKVGGFLKNAKDSIDQKHQRKVLEKKLEDSFRSRKMCQRLDCVINEPKQKTIRVVGELDYDFMTLTIYGENCSINKSAYFVDRANQVLKIGLIKLNQEIEIPLGGDVYKRPATIIELEIEKDEIKQEEVKTVINNTNVYIENSKIKGSNIGGIDDDN